MHKKKMIFAILIIGLIIFLLHNSIPALSNTESTETLSNYYGFSSAEVDNELSLTDMLIYALQEEYRTQSESQLIVETFGAGSEPFIKILEEEKANIYLLTNIFDKYGLTLPSNDAKEYIITPDTLSQSINQGVLMETAKVAMYEKFINNNLPKDVEAVFTQLKESSRNSLIALGE